MIDPEQHVMTRSLAALLAVVVMRPTLLCAQQGERSARWGLIGSVTPAWSAAQRVGDYVGADQYDISGAEFSIGVVRGRDYSGDWGVSFVWKGISETSTSRFGTREVCNPRTCVEESTAVVAKDVSMIGVEAHKFFSLVSIGRRAQLGVNAALGVLRVRGTSEETDRYAAYQFDPSTGTVILTQKTEVSEVGGGQIFTVATDVQTVLSAKLEVGANLVLTRSLKARISGGIDFPGYHAASVKLIYLFGRPGPESIFR